MRIRYLAFLVILLAILPPASAWYDSSWGYRANIQICPAVGSTIDGNSLVRITTNQTAMAGIQNDAQDVRIIVNEDGNESVLEYVAVDTNQFLAGDNNASIFFRTIENYLIDSCTPTDSDSNGAYSIYWQNDSAGQWGRSPFDENYIPYFYPNPPDSLGSWAETSSSPDYDEITGHSYHSGGTDGTYIWHTGQAAAFAGGVGNTFFWRINILDADDNSATSFLWRQGASKAARLSFMSDEMHFNGEEGEDKNSSGSGTYSQNTWHDYQIIFSSDGELYVYMDGQTTPILSTTAGNTAGTMIRMIQHQPASGSGESAISYFGYTATAYFPVGYIIGTAETSEQAPDVNISAIELYSLKTGALPAFSYQRDVNLLVDFNIFDADSNSLIIDINYSSSNTQGTGTVIWNDLNSLTSDANCEAGALSSVRKCSIDWNISAVSDGNYFIIIEVSDGSGTDFDASDLNVNIDNTAPSVAVDAPASDYDVVAGVVSLNNTISDANNAITGAYIDTNISSPCWSDKNITSGGGWDTTWDTSAPCSSDFHVLETVWAVDSAGNWGSAQRKFIVDNTTPLITIISPDNNKYYNSGIDINVNYYNINLKDVNYVILQYVGSGGDWNTEYNYMDGNAEYNIPAAPDWNFTDQNTQVYPTGSYIIKAWGRDKGNTITTKYREFFIDLSNPSITLRTPDSYDYNSTTISFDVNDNMDLNYLTFTIDINGTSSTYFDAAADCTAFDGNYFCTYSEDSFSYGLDYNIYITIGDTAGNSDTNQYIINYTGAPPPPVVGAVVIVVDANCEITLETKRFETYLLFISSIKNSFNEISNLDANITLYSPNYDQIVFEEKIFVEKSIGIYEYTHDGFFGNGFYSARINVDANCVKIFGFEITDAPLVKGAYKFTGNPTTAIVLNSGKDTSSWLEGTIPIAQLINAVMGVILLLLIIGGYRVVKYMNGKRKGVK